LGFGGIWLLTTFDIISLSKDVYGFSKLPVDLTAIDFISIIAGTFIICAFIIYISSKEASSTDPLTVFRSE